MRYDGVDGLSLRNGNVVIKTSISDVMELKPYAYQQVDGREVAVECDYVLDKQNRMLTFSVGDYNRNLPLVIDPQLIFSTYTGSAADNWGTTATYDLNRNTYSSGVVFGVGIPVISGLWIPPSTAMPIWEYSNSMPTAVNAYMQHTLEVAKPICLTVCMSTNLMSLW
jgi:hypothetical protein